MALICGKRLKILSIRFYLLLFLFWLSSSLSINAMTQDDILNNLSISEQLLTTLNQQLTVLETDLNNRNQSLLNLEMANQDLNQQLTTLQVQFNNQTDTLSNLSQMNQMLMGQLEQSVAQFTDLNQQYQQLSRELSKQGSNDIWWFIGGVLIGGVVTGLSAWLLVTY